MHFVFSAHEGTYFATEESLRHWKRVHALYQSLPEEERFSLLGVDVEHYPVFALQYLHRLLMQLESDGWKNTKLADITAVLEEGGAFMQTKPWTFLRISVLNWRVRRRRHPLGP